MLAVLQAISGGYTTQTLKSDDIEYLAYQLVKKHSITAIVNMDTQTLNKEIDEIIRGNNYGSN